MYVCLILSQEDKPSGSGQLHLDTLQCTENGASRSRGYVLPASIGTFNFVFENLTVCTKRALRVCLSVTLYPWQALSGEHEEVSRGTRLVWTLSQCGIAVCIIVQAGIHGFSEATCA